VEGSRPTAWPALGFESENRLSEKALLFQRFARAGAISYVAKLPSRGRAKFPERNLCETEPLSFPIIPCHFAKNIQKYVKA